jgi:hypothetical protein
MAIKHRIKSFRLKERRLGRRVSARYFDVELVNRLTSARVKMAQPVAAGPGSAGLEALPGGRLLARLWRASVSSDRRIRRDGWCQGNRKLI